MADLVERVGIANILLVLAALYAVGRIHRAMWLLDRIDDHLTDIKDEVADIRKKVAPTRTDYGE